MRAAALSILVLVTAVMVAASSRLRVTPDRYCLACLCNAATNCAAGIGCRRLLGQVRCGPFLLTKDAWRRARYSRSTFATRFRYLNFRTCANDLECSGEAVRTYMMMTASDCDRDGSITCWDFGVLLRDGVAGCSNRTQSTVPQRLQALPDFYSKLRQCQDDVDLLLKTPPPPPGCGFVA